METPEVKTKVYDPPNRGPGIDIRESKKTDPPTRYVQDSVKIHQPKFHVFIQDSGPICCICVFVFARLTHGNIILNILEKKFLSNIYHILGLSGNSWHAVFVYFVFVYFFGWQGLWDRREGTQTHRQTATNGLLDIQT